jgi:hypothetical protein
MAGYRGKAGRRGHRGQSQVVELELYVCEGCGQEWVVPRSTARGRPVGHRKHLYCAHCEDTMPYRRVVA